MEIIKKFKTVKGEYVDVVEHTISIMKQYPNVQVHVGTDSQNISNQTVYVTVIAFRYGTNGVHYIYYKERKPRKMTGNISKDIWDRLWREAEMSIEVAEWLKAQMNILIQIDMDYNEDDLWESNKLIQAASGWASSLGYQVNCKPNIQIATKAADYQCT
jgi:predicted RNase H-related nuclease YkuK (DUF458 family)